MTIITAISSDSGIFIGYNDGAELGGTPVRGTSTPWILFGAWALGITGESSVQRLLQNELRDYSGGDDSNELISHINNILVENGIGSKSDTEYVTTFGIYAILVHKTGRIWDVSGCLSLTEMPRGLLWAQGSGADYAMGARYAINVLHPEITDERAMLICIESAIENDIHCVGSAKIQRWEPLS